MAMPARWRILGIAASLALLIGELLPIAVTTVGDGLTDVPMFVDHDLSGPFIAVAGVAALYAVAIGRGHWLWLLATPAAGVFTIAFLKFRADLDVAHGSAAPFLSRLYRTRFVRPLAGGSIGPCWFVIAASLLVLLAVAGLSSAHLPSRRRWLLLVVSGILTVLTTWFAIVVWSGLQMIDYADF